MFKSARAKIRAFSLLCVLAAPWAARALGARSEPVGPQTSAAPASNPTQNQCRNRCQESYVACDADADDAFSQCECFNAWAYCLINCGVWPHPQPMTCTDGF